MKVAVILLVALASTATQSAPIPHPSPQPQLGWLNPLHWFKSNSPASTPATAAPATTNTSGTNSTGDLSSLLSAFVTPDNSTTNATTSNSSIDASNTSATASNSSDTPSSSPSNSKGSGSSDSTSSGSSLSNDDSSSDDSSTGSTTVTGAGRKPNSSSPAQVAPPKYKSKSSSKVTPQLGTPVNTTYFTDDTTTQTPHKLTVSSGSTGLNALIASTSSSTSDSGSQDMDNSSGDNSTTANVKTTPDSLNDTSNALSTSNDTENATRLNTTSSPASYSQSVLGDGDDSTNFPNTTATNTTATNTMATNTTATNTTMANATGYKASNPFNVSVTNTPDDSTDSIVGLDGSTDGSGGSNSTDDSIDSSAGTDSASTPDQLNTASTLNKTVSSYFNPANVSSSTIDNRTFHDLNATFFGTDSNTTAGTLNASTVVASNTSTAPKTTAYYGTWAPPNQYGNATTSTNDTMTGMTSDPAGADEAATDSTNTTQVDGSTALNLTSIANATRF
ncbi:BQ2448_7377 [Microbotryum intermedium]|uniref:BQ2448_7377 protein n=1 Tax=Microbotryum intermedium TaxID=269621 RepID=A0A238FMR8_9BASI|nr:BQ2448_7377 [Microbotryum intermedium]